MQRMPLFNLCLVFFFPVILLSFFFFFFFPDLYFLIPCCQVSHWLGLSLLETEIKRQCPSILKPWVRSVLPLLLCCYSSSLRFNTYPDLSLSLSLSVRHDGYELLEGTAHAWPAMLFSQGLAEPPANSRCL